MRVLKQFLICLFSLIVCSLINNGAYLPVEEREEPLPLYLELTNEELEESEIYQGEQDVELTIFQLGSGGGRATCSAILQNNIFQTIRHYLILDYPVHKQRVKAISFPLYILFCSLKIHFC